MRKFILMIAVLSACSKTETAKTDTAAPAMAPPPAAPAALTAADMSGTWKGTTMAEQGDSASLGLQADEPGPESIAAQRVRHGGQAVLLNLGDGVLGVFVAGLEDPETDTQERLQMAAQGVGDENRRVLPQIVEGDVPHSTGGAGISKGSLLILRDALVEREQEAGPPSHDQEVPADRGDSTLGLIGRLEDDGPALGADIPTEGVPTPLLLGTQVGRQGKSGQRDHRDDATEHAHHDTSWDFGGTWQGGQSAPCWHLTGPQKSLIPDAWLMP